MWRSPARLSLPRSIQKSAIRLQARFLSEHRPSQQNMAGTGDDARPDYTTWSNSSLIDRISELERQLHSQTAQYNAPTIAAPEVAPHAPISIDVHEPAIPLAEPAIQPSKKRALSPEADITHTPAPSRGTKQDRGFDPSKYSTRYIALKFAYLGQRYNGLEHTNGNATPLPTIEEVLWKAMRRTRLITPETSSEDEPNDVEPRVMRPYSIYWDGCEYSKAGRTDRGVSAFGQVVGVRVRSARPKPKPKATTEQEADAMQIEESSVSNDWDDVADELNYIQLLNRVLPEDIRVLAWCPNPPPGFDARFSCRERRYRYFFTQPAFSPTPGSFGFEDRRGKGTGPRSKFREGWLDIEAMREAAKHFEGTHDFRNFCKLDTSKQIENFERIIYRSDIEFVNPKSNPLGYIGRPGFQKMEDDVLDMDMSMEASENPSTSTPQVYSFTLHGSAFLWHQVRHMVAILFLVGQGLESPSIVAELLDIAKNPRKPTYEMASDAPLVLWDCIFPDESSGSREDSLNWVYAGDPRLNKTQSAKGDSKFGMKGVVDELWSVWRHRKIEEILAGALLDLTVSQGDQTHVQHLEGKQGTSKKQSRGVKVWLGADEARAGGKYVPVSEKTKTETVEVQNAKWLVSKERKTAVKEKEAASKTQSA